MTLAKYGIGFGLSLLLTLAAYSLVMYGGTSPWLLASITLLAVVQMVVQLIFFLHLGEEASPRAKLLSFIFMAGTLLIIVVGSLWIMANMNYNMMHMTSAQKDNYMTNRNEMAF